MSRFIPHGVKPTRPPLKESSGTVKECMWQRNRLPRSLVPKLYNLHLHPNLVTEKYSGLVEIEVAVIQKTSLVVLHAKNLSIQSAIIREVGKEGQKDETFSRLQSCTALDQLQLSSRRMLLPENRYILAIHFDSILPHSMDGFYISNYEDDNGKSGYGIRRTCLALLLRFCYGFLESWLRHSLSRYTPGMPFLVLTNRISKRCFDWR